jgi:hypothetical protein
MKMGESQRTFNDVVTYQADANFAVKQSTSQTWPSKCSPVRSLKLTAPHLPPAMMHYWF